MRSRRIAAASLARGIGRRLVNFAAFNRRKLSWMGLLACGVKPSVN